MTLRTTKYRVGVLGLTVATLCAAAAVPAYGQDSGSVGKRQPASKQENIGFATGLTVGAVAGGPVGAIVGAAAGAWLGDRYHKQAAHNTELTSDLTKVEGERTLLAQNLTRVNDSLMETEARNAKLGEAMKLTDEIQTDVGFRTNDAAVNAYAMPPLLKLGALAASMPDVKVRVEGYADPRGSEAYNDELSQRRAAAVADVLAGAGVPRDHLIVEGHGKTESTTEEGDLDGYAFDRRVTVRIEHAGKTSEAEVARRE
jgi:outer membrane protein OmpA-like peptidoglycan-associated protein